MTDIHTHILPGMDDGCTDLRESLMLLEQEREQGVDTVFLTPHFYRVREPAERFLLRRQKCWEVLRQACPTNAPDLILGAEVAWFPSLPDENRLEELCLGDSAHLLLELPFEPWSSLLLDQIYDFAGATGITPVLAHVERYLPLQEKSKIQDLLSMGFPLQMNADSVLGFYSRKRCLPLLRQGSWYLGSDCHDLVRRPPRLRMAAELLRKKLGNEETERLVHWPM